ncbi:unnamed protein product [Medioppia subpectinata]|uniref:F-box domain-containing protein n=1 Tax=Medioppia subpectinata TaxID=1979941 RepID=A0A7R9L1G2_9ACAR|nr:unnamed protein product [Medioppia subpectinata]CAG2113504.1 unnamed protein product [Medioppia subpectinata]
MAKQMKHLKTSLETTDDGNEDIKQQPQIYAKDSFDGFGDDLCGLIVSYLSFEDRFRLECVSKQFQRTVFGSVVNLTIDHLFFSHYKAVNSAKSQMLATIAIKCSNIESIDCYAMQDKHIPEVLAVFRDKCLQICGTLWREFGLEFVQQFAPLMTRINSMDKQQIPSLIHCHRLSELSVDSLSDIFDTTSGQLLAKNLKTFSFHCYKTSDEGLMSAFVDQNQSLECLHVYMYSGSHETRQQLCQQLSQLPHLRDLLLYLRVGNGDNSLAESLRTIGENCKQLKQLSLMLSSVNKKLDSKTLDALPSYPRLRRLTLSHHFGHKFMKPLKRCKGLTHLTLYSMKLSDTLLANCDKQWPRLQYLRINCMAGNGFTFSSKSLGHISRLSALQTLLLGYGVGIDLNDNALKDLLTGMSKLKRIEVNGVKVSIGLPSK